MGTILWLGSKGEGVVLGKCSHSSIDFNLKFNCSLFRCRLDAGDSEGSPLLVDHRCVVNGVLSSQGVNVFK